MFDLHIWLGLTNNYNGQRFHCHNVTNKPNDVIIDFIVSGWYNIGSGKAIGLLM